MSNPTGPIPPPTGPSNTYTSGHLVVDDQMNISNVTQPTPLFAWNQRLSILRVLRWMEENLFDPTLELEDRAELDTLREKLTSLTFNRHTERWLRYTYLYWYHRLTRNTSEETSTPSSSPPEGLLRIVDRLMMSAPTTSASRGSEGSNSVQVNIMVNRDENGNFIPLIPITNGQRVEYVPVDLESFATV